MHEPALSNEYVPALQSRQLLAEVAPVISLKYPAAQFVGDEEPAAAQVPSGATVHEILEVAPGIDEKVPAEQGIQVPGDEAPTLFEYDPA